MRKLTKIIGFAAAGMMLALMAAGCNGSGKGSLNVIAHLTFDEYSRKLLNN